MSIVPSGDFDWHDDVAIIVLTQPAIAIYTNPSGGIVIRQEGWGEDSDVFVVIRPENAAAVASAIMREAGGNG